MISAEALSRAVRVAVAAPAVAFAIGIGPGGCSPKSSAPASPGGVEETCPSSVDAAVGASCSKEGFACYPQYMCGVTPAILTCVCTEGSFSCQDVTGKLVASGASPACPPAAAGESCPTSELLARGQQCTRPGLFCAYPSTCGDTTKYDGCYCFTGPLMNGQMALRFECSSPCNYDAGSVGQDAMVDASVAQGLVDAAVDARDANTE